MCRVGAAVHVQDEKGWRLLQKLLCSVRLFHRDSRFFLSDNASPRHYAQRIAGLVSSRVVSCRYAPSAWSFGVLTGVVAQARASAASHVVFLQHSMSLLRPLPIESMPCPLTAFQTIPAHHFISSVSKAFILRYWVELQARQHLGAKVREHVGNTSGAYSLGFVATADALRRLALGFERTRGMSRPRLGP